MIAIRHLFQDNYLKISTAFSAGLVVAASIATMKARSEAIRLLALSALSICGHFLFRDLLLYRDCYRYFKERHVATLTEEHKQHLESVRKILCETNFGIIPFVAIVSVQTAILNVRSHKIFKRPLIRAHELLPHIAISVIISIVSSEIFSYIRLQKNTLRKIDKTGFQPLDDHKLYREGYRGLVASLAYINLIIFLKRIAWMK